MAPEQQQAIYQEVAEQQAMKKAADAAAAAQSAEVDAQLDYLRRLGNATEAEIAFKRAEARKAVAAENAERARAARDEVVPHVAGLHQRGRPRVLRQIQYDGALSARRGSAGEGRSVARASV